LASFTKQITTLSAETIKLALLISMPCGGRNTLPGAEQWSDDNGKVLRDTVAYLEEKELKAGDEHLTHPECTKRADEVRKLITDLRAIKAKYGKRS
jgi:hypothetical protein